MEYIIYMYIIGKLMFRVKCFHSSQQTADITWTIDDIIRSFKLSHVSSFHPQLGFGLKYGLLTKNLSCDHGTARRNQSH